jgi:hypothetical protein
MAASGDTTARSHLITLLIMRVLWVAFLVFLTIKGIEIVRAWLLISNLCLPSLPASPGFPSTRTTVRGTGQSDAPTMYTAM